MYKLMLGDFVVAETDQPITWSDTEQAWYVVLPDIPTHFCDSNREMTVVQA